jgi:hypothetical protein
MDRGNELIVDAAERNQLRAQARRVHVRSLVTAAALTAISLLIPE